MTGFHLTRRTLIMAGASTLGFSCSARPDPREEPPAPALTGIWQDGPNLPYATQEIYPAFFRGRIHLAGGFIAEGDEISGVTDRHIALDIATQLWNEQPALPSARHHPNLITFHDHLLAIGGFMARSEQAVWVMQAGVWAFDGEVWRDAPSLPQPNGESVCGVLPGGVHVCGGRKPKGDSNATWNDHTDIADHFVLSDLNSSWDVAAPLPTARNSAAAAIIGKDWHVVGGRTVSSGNTSAHEVYDAKEDRWRPAAPMPQGQGGLAAASVGGKLYAFGGEYFDNGGGVYPESWVYDPASDAWSALPDMPHPRHGLGAVTVEDAIYVIAGARRVGGSQTSNLVEVFTP